MEVSNTTPKESLDQPRPDSPTLPDLPPLARTSNHCRDRHPPLLGQRSEWMEAKYGQKDIERAAGIPRIDYGAVTHATALNSHTPTDEERAWLSKLSERYRTQKEQKKTQEVEQLLKKSAVTKQEEMNIALFGAMAGSGSQQKITSRTSAVWDKSRRKRQSSILLNVGSKVLPAGLVKKLSVDRIMQRLASRFRGNRK